jgi:hypothetical protein
MNLIKDIAANKIAYQVYNIDHGIEHFKIKIPLILSADFESEIKSYLNIGNDKAALLRIISRFNGTKTL